MSSIVGKIKVSSVVENEDGGATYTFDIDDKANEVIYEFGLKLILYCGATGTDIDYVFDHILGKVDE